MLCPGLRHKPQRLTFFCVRDLGCSESATNRSKLPVWFYYRHSNEKAEELASPPLLRPCSGPCLGPVSSTVGTSIN